MFIIGFTLLTGLTVANWIKENPGIIQTGIPTLDQVFTVLLSSALFIGGILGFFFDNTLPGEPDNLLIFILIHPKIRGIEILKSATLTGMVINFFFKIMTFLFRHLAAGSDLSGKTFATINES